MKVFGFIDVKKRCLIGMGTRGLGVRDLGGFGGEKSVRGGAEEGLRRRWKCICMLFSFKNSYFKYL
jgi:hypothetical protein